MIKNIGGCRSIANFFLYLFRVGTSKKYSSPSPEKNKQVIFIKNHWTDKSGNKSPTVHGTKIIDTSFDRAQRILYDRLVSTIQ